MTSSYTGATTMSSQNYTRLGGSGTYYYQAIEVRVPTTGTYTIRSYSTIADTIGYIYQGNFYPSYPQYNVVAQDDEGAGGGQFQIIRALRSDLVYYIIFTAYHGRTTGRFEITVTGDAAVSLTPVFINN